MPGAGTDKTKAWIERPGPVVILVEPQLGENIGAAARAMANFGLSRLRLVRPRQGWPNGKARIMAVGADRILDGAVLYDSLEAAIGDCSFVFAATARAHDQAKAVVGRRRRRRWRRRASQPARPSPSCSAASAMASKTTRWRLPTVSSRSRSTRPSPRSIWRKRS